MVTQRESFVAYTKGGRSDLQHAPPTQKGAGLICLQSQRMEVEGKELFVSYGRDPIVSQFVEKLKIDLEVVGFSVWMDTHDIPAGSDWHGAIGAGLSHCKAIIPVITQKYLSSRYCVNELYTADSDKKLIFPVFLEDVDFDASESGQGVKFTTSGVNWTMCRLGKDDYSSSISKLISAMKEKGLGKGSSHDTENGSTAPLSSIVKREPLVGPVSSMPFKVIPDVENPEGITSTPEGGLIVSIVRQKVLLFNANHEKILELGGEPGLGMGQFLSPTGVAIDDKGDILVASHYYVKKFSREGRCLQQAGGTGADGSFSIESPRGLVIGKHGRVYISEQQKHRVTILNSDLTLYKRFSEADRMLGSGHLNLPQGLAVNNNGDVYVADMMNHVIQVFDAEGIFLFRFGGMGHGPGTTTSPTAVAIDLNDYVYVGSGTGTVSIFSTDGKFVRMFGEHGIEVGKFSMIRAMHIDKNGVLYVGEWTSNRIQMFHTKQTAEPPDTVNSGVTKVTGQMQAISIQASPSVDPAQHLPSAALNITGEGKGMTTIGGSVYIGPGTVFRTHVAIQPGAQVVAHHGNIKVPIPVAVPTTPVSTHDIAKQGSVIFAKPANTTCTQAGVRKPAWVLETDETVVSMSVNNSGFVVVSGKTVTLYNSVHEKLHNLRDRDFSGACMVFENETTIVAITNLYISRLDLQLKVLSKVHLKKVPGLSNLTYPYAIASGTEGRLYTAGSEKCHIIDSTLNECKNFAENCGQAFGIAVSKSGNVYVPIQKENTVCVFSPDGSPMFRFGGPDRVPLPHMSLHVPMSIAIDSNDDVYVGIALQSITKFNGEGKFLEQFAARINFEAIPKPMCTNPNRQCLYVAVEKDKKNKILAYKLQSIND